MRCNSYLKTALDFLTVFFFTLWRVNVAFDDIFDLEFILFKWHFNKWRFENPEGSVCKFRPLANNMRESIYWKCVLLSISKTLSGSNIIVDLYCKHKWLILCHCNILQRNWEQSAVIKMSTWNYSSETNKNCLYDSVLFIYKCCRVYKYRAKPLFWNVLL